MEGANLGYLTLIPVISFFVLVFATKRCIVSILVSGFLSYVLFYGIDFFYPMMDALQESAADMDNNHIVIICLLFGCSVQLLGDSRGAIAVGDWARDYVKSDKQALLLTWVCGVIIFIDDYLGILVTANYVMSLSDEQKVPREMLCYVINTTSAPVCLITPISAWVVFFSGVFFQLPEAHVVADSAMGIYYNITPYFFCPFLCVIMVPLVTTDVIPKLGGMKKAYERVKETGKLWPDSSDILNEETKINVADGEETTKEMEPKLWASLVLVLVVVVVTILLDDILYGVTIGILTCLVLFVSTKILSSSEFCDSCFRGLEDMVFIAVVLVISLSYRESINSVGLSEFLIDVASPYMSVTWLPAVSFILIGLVCLVTGNIWNVPALCAPIILPLAVGTGANIPLTLGAIISAACFGVQACFYSDVTLTSASARRINNVDHATAQLPYIFIVSAISFIAYVVAGFVM